MPAITLLPLKDPQVIADVWRRVCAGLELEAVFGPEGRDPRPRAKDTYFLAWDPDHLDRRPCGDGAIGLVYTQRPAPTTMAFALGLFPEYRGRGLGPIVRDAAIELCFDDPAIYKVESEVYAGNAHSLGALHGKYARTKPEGRQRATICVRGQFYDRLLFGLTREEWAGMVP